MIHFCYCPIGFSGYGFYGARRSLNTVWDKAAVEIDHAEESAQLLLGGRRGKIGKIVLNLFRKGATSVAADFVTEALVGVDRQAEVIETGENSVEVLYMISRRLTYHQYIIDVDENEIEVSEDGVHERLESLTGIL